MAEPMRLTRSTGGIITGVAHHLGYTPTDSLATVLVARDLITGVLCADLPHTSRSVDLYRDLLRERIRHLTGVSAAVLVGYGPQPPVVAAAHITTQLLTAAQIPVRHCLRVAGPHGWHHLSTDPDCARRLFPLPSDAMAAAFAAATGRTLHRDRAALRRYLAGHGSERTATTAATDTAAARLSELVAATAAVHGQAGSITVAEAIRAEGIATLTTVTTRYRADLPVQAADAAYLTVLLTSTDLRNHAAAQLTNAPWATSMWTDLLHRADPRYAATPATLLALTALLTGDGALATTALDRALTVDPGNEFAHLLTDIAAADPTPDTVSALIARIAAGQRLTPTT